MDVGIPSPRFYPLLVMKKRDWHSGTPLVRDDALSHRPADGLVEDGLGPRTNPKQQYLSAAE
ncbi:hypothetical protein PABG_12305 [Paracoccidioides brasiliensis Pb03]|nr:hypothetical protein PABG_12305 [Paracoccidioides brasiliensis Pb03]